MSSKQTSDLIRLCDLYAEATGLSHWRISALARSTGKGPGDGRFFHRLRNGASCLVTTESLVKTWFSENWPPDLPWPEDIPRPDAHREDAA